MSPEEKVEELLNKFSHERVFQIVNHMVLYYSGIGVDDIRLFWEQTGEILIYKQE